MSRKLALGLLAGMVLGSSAMGATINIYDDSIAAGQTKTWSETNKYILHGKVCVEDGARLYIPAGTKVYADANSNAATTMLIVCRGGRLYVNGTAAEPVIFTSEIDDGTTQLPLTNDARGLWGGINVLGRAPINAPGGVLDISSDVTYPDTSKLRYGDSTAADIYDTSGVFRYMSVRYTGMSDKAQIKGLVFAGVGKGTIIDHVESFMFGEDGFQFLGGTVDAKYLISAFHAGDGFYAESGYQGRIQYLFAIQNVVAGSAVNGCMAKIEGGDPFRYPLTVPIIYNATFIGTGINNPDTWKYKYGLYFKKNGSGIINNSILTQCSNYGLYVEDKGAFGTVTDSISSRARLDSGSLVFNNNIIYGFGKTNTIDSIAKGLTFLQSYLSADSNHNTLADPQIASFSWLRDGNLDPRPSASGPATQNVATVPMGGFFDQTTYRGAFAPTGPLWASNWSALATTGIFSSTSVPVLNHNQAISKSMTGFKINGKGNLRQITWNQSIAAKSSVKLYSTNGKLLRILEDSFKSSGLQTVSISLNDLSSGIYLLQIKGAKQSLSSLIEKQ